MLETRRRRGHAGSAAVTVKRPLSFPAPDFSPNPDKGTSSANAAFKCTQRGGRDYFRGIKYTNRAAPTEAPSAFGTVLPSTASLPSLHPHVHEGEFPAKCLPSCFLRSNTITKYLRDKAEWFSISSCARTALLPPCLAI